MKMTPNLKGTIEKAKKLLAKHNPKTMQCGVGMLANAGLSMDEIQEIQSSIK